jgi:hypothetical protein
MRNSKAELSRRSVLAGLGVAIAGGVVATPSAFAATTTDVSAAYAPAQSPQPNDVRNYGAIGDFVSHPLSQRFDTLTAAQAVYPEATSLTDEIDWCAITRCIAVNGSVYLSPDCAGNRTFVVNKAIDTSTRSGVLMYGDSTATLIVQTSTNTPVLIMANSGNIVRSLSVGYVSQRPSSETNSICIYMSGGAAGGSFYNSSFVNVKAQNGAYGWFGQLSPVGTAVFSVSWRDCEVQNFSIWGFRVDSTFGMTSNRVDNLYIHNNTGGSGHSATRGVATGGGFHVQGWQSGSIDNVNVEHLTAPVMMCIDSCPGTSLRSFYSENCEINVNNSGILRLLATNTGVPVVGMSAAVTGMSVAYGQFLAASGCTNVGLIYVAQGAKVQLASIQAHNNTITAANANVVYSDCATTASIYVTDATVDAGFAPYNTGIAGQVKRYGDVWNIVPSTILPPSVLGDGGEACFDPRLATSAVKLANMRLQLSYFTAALTETCTRIAVNTGSTAAGARPTLVRFGLYSVAANGDLTLVAATTNDTTLLAAANTRYAKATSAAFVKIQGQRYATAVLVVSAAIMPSIFANGPMGGTGLSMLRTGKGRRQARVASQTDLPLKISNASITIDGNALYVEVLP